ncbi:hypothetical protein OH76DRAFT_1394930 [Lentinus brumalis]|uniref:Uncharacterized protein n=1 Tax=Lentinus brumalis TaxID=2498619 RepID=A0A371DX69_9APHY|nr:hypothetical protein OH76DRAFT_1394930 [Polyporus brumalis]
MCVVKSLGLNWDHRVTESGEHGYHIGELYLDICGILDTGLDTQRRELLLPESRRLSLL